MKILWISEMNFKGVIDKSINNLKSDVALIASAEAYHIPYLYPLKVEDLNGFDFMMFNCTQKFFTEPMIINNLDEYKKHIKVGFFQEGPINDWQMWRPREQVLWINSMKKIDAYFCSNIRDIPYYKSYVRKEVPVFWLKSPINLERITKNIKNKEDRDGIVLGGTVMCKWYNGQTSLEIAKALKDKIYIPSMGRLQDTEPIWFNSLAKNRIFLLPYSNFDTWINYVSNMKYGVHCMPSVAAGSFTTCLANLKIPCIGNEEIDTQRLLFPKLSIHPYRDITKGRKLIKRLEQDDMFYNDIVNYAFEKVKEWDLDIIRKELYKMIEKIIK